MKVQGGGVWGVLGGACGFFSLEEPREQRGAFGAELQKCRFNHFQRICFSHFDNAIVPVWHDRPDAFASRRLPIAFAL